MGDSAHAPAELSSKNAAPTYGHHRRHASPVSQAAEQKIIVELPTGVKNVIKFYLKPDWRVKDLLIFICKKLKINPQDHYLVHDYKELHLKEEVENLGFKQDSVVKVFFGRKSLSKGVRVSLAVSDVKVSSLFKNTDNLWYIVNVLLAKDSFDPELVPVVIYKKEEFIGEKSIRKVRLRDIGMTSGTVALRFFQLKKEDLDHRHGDKLEENISQTTLLSLDALVSTGVTDIGMKFVHFKEDDEAVIEDEYLDERRTVAFSTMPHTMEETTVEEFLMQKYFDFTLAEISTFKDAVEIQLKTLDKREVCRAVESILNHEREYRKKDCVETVVRIQFADNHALQAFFSVLETIDDVMQLVIKHTNFSANEFDLSRSLDSADIIDPICTLTSADCVPCATLHCIAKNAGLEFYETFPTENITLTNITVANETALLLRGDSLDAFFSVDHSRFKSLLGKKHSSKKNSSVGHMSFLTKKSPIGPSLAANRFIRESRTSYDSRKTTDASQDIEGTVDEDNESDIVKTDYRISRLRKQRRNTLTLGSIDVEPPPTFVKGLEGTKSAPPTRESKVV